MGKKDDDRKRQAEDLKAALDLHDVAAMGKAAKEGDEETVAKIARRHQDLREPRDKK